MKKINFDIKDILGYVSEHTSIQINKDFHKNDELKTDTNPTRTEELLSLNSQSKKLEKHITSRVTMILIGIPIIIFFIVVFYKTYQLIQEDSVRVAPKKSENKKLDLKVNSDYKWKVLKDQETQSIAIEMKRQNAQLQKDMNKTISIVEQKLKISETVITKELQKLQEEIKKSNRTVNNKFDSFNNMQERINKKLELQKNKLLKEIKKSEKKQLEQQKVNVKHKFLPTLPPLKTRITHTTTTPKESKEKVVVINKSESSTKENINEDEYLIISEEIDGGGVIAYSSLDINTEGNNSKQELPVFKIMPGFVKGTLLNGAEVPIILGGDNESIPVYIRINGDQLIPNDASVNLDGCLIIATAKGDLSKHAVNLRLSKMSCNITDLDGNSFVVENTNMQGWVFSENGSYDIHGRVVSREKDIIKAGLPLAMTEAMIQSLMTAVQNSTSTTLVDSSSADLMSSLKQGAGAGMSNTTNKILAKFSDYYLKLLESLNPNISIRAGREVVIAFKGGEDMKMEEYTPLNTSYFEEMEMEEVDEEW